MIIPQQTRVDRPGLISKKKFFDDLAGMGYSRILPTIFIPRLTVLNPTKTLTVQNMTKITNKRMPEMTGQVTI
jgi:hypothetical protein